jgi:hypothetical protein
MIRIIQWKKIHHRLFELFQYQYYFSDDNDIDDIYHIRLQHIVKIENKLTKSMSTCGFDLDRLLTY